MSAEFESGMFVRKGAWHEMGNVLDFDPNTDTAFLKSGLDWNVKKEKLFFNFNLEMRESDTFGVIRESDGSFLGVCKDRYTLFQNKEAFEWCRPLVESNLYKWESAGSLQGGRTCWALLNSGNREIIKGDTLKNYLLCTWSHDGSKSVTIKPTSIRVVCNNTLTAAMQEEGKKDHIRHTQSMSLRLEDVRRYYEESEEFFLQQQQDFLKLLNTSVSADMKEMYMKELDKILFVGESNTKRAISHKENVHKDILYMMDRGASQQRELGIQNTLYGMFQATTEYLEHYATQKGDKDGYSVLFGNRGKQIESAFDIAMRFADGNTPFIPAYQTQGTAMIGA